MLAWLITIAWITLNLTKIEPVVKFLTRPPVFVPGHILLSLVMLVSSILLIDQISSVRNILLLQWNFFIWCCSGSALQKLHPLQKMVPFWPPFNFGKEVDQKRGPIISSIISVGSLLKERIFLKLPLKNYLHNSETRKKFFWENQRVPKLKGSKV